MRYRKIAILAGAIFNLGLGAAHAGDIGDVPMNRCKPVTFREVSCREFNDWSEKVSEAIDEVHRSLEEWGTLSLSGLILAPPTGTFGVDINETEREKGKKYNFDHWFSEASKREGSEQATERIFNTFAASGTLQLAPEQAAVAGAVFEKQKVDEQLFQDQLERNRVQRAAELNTFQLNRENAVQAHRLKIDTAQAAVDSARTDRMETELARTGANNRRKAALVEVDAAQAALDAVPALPENAEKRATLRQALQQRQTAYATANQEFRTIDDDLRARVADEKRKQDDLVTAKSSDIPAVALPGAQITPVTSSPTFNETNTTFESVMTPGGAIAQARSFAKSIPVVRNVPDVPGIDATKLPELLGAAGKGEISSAFPARARLIDAASNQIISRIFDFLGDPTAALSFQDKPILMAAGTIAANPGWRTWQDYDGQIDVAATYKWGPARQETCARIAQIGALKGDIYTKEEIAVARHYAKTLLWPEAQEDAVYATNIQELTDKPGAPLAAAVSPLMERQNIDQASSRARQDEIALFLSASLARSGQKAAGEIFDKYIKMRRLDVKTLSSLPVVNSYGLGGTRFGFNVTSRLQAVGSPNKPKAAQILEKQNFPVLVVFGMSADNIRPVLIKNGQSEQIWEPYIVLTQAHRWSRQKKRGDFHQVLRSIAIPGFPGRPMESPAESYQLMNQLQRTLEGYDLFLGDRKTLAKDSLVNKFTLAAREDADFLQQACFSAVNRCEIPVETLAGPVPGRKPESVRATIASILPSSVLTLRSVTVAGKTTYQTRIILLGNNLNLVNPKGLAVGDGVEVQSVPLPEGLSDDNGIALNLIFQKPPEGPVQVKAALKQERKDFASKIYSPMMTFR